MKTYETRPNSLSLAAAMTSSSVEKGVSGATGPKISSRAIAAEAGTPVMTVGG